MDEARERILRLIQEPPANSGLLAAKTFGIDLSQVVRNMLLLSPTGRLEQMQNAAKGLRDLAEARSGKRSGSSKNH